MLVDSHCHLDRLDLSLHENSLENVLCAARLQGVSHFLCVGIDAENASEVIAIAEQYPDVSAATGIHPTELMEKEVTLAQLIQWGSHPKVVAIGETGLDYYREGDKQLQQARFRQHIRAAKAVNKPLIVHTRHAQSDTLRILKEEEAETIGGVLHCFTETLDMALAAISLNFLISFSGILTFKNASSLKDIAQTLPLEKILIETDSPYLAPMPFRGKPNQPAYVRFVAEYLAELKKETIDTVARRTTENFFKLFVNATC